MMQPARDDLATAIILLERPEIGPGGYRERARLPLLVRLRAGVVDGGMIGCAVSADAVQALARSDRAPTWGDLQSVWQDVSALLHLRIRAAGRARATAASTPTNDEITLTAADLPQSMSRTSARAAVAR